MEKVKVKFALKSQEGEKKYSATLSLTSELDWGGCLTLSPAALPMGKRFGTHDGGVRVGLGAGLDGCGTSRPHWNSIPGPCSL